MHSPSQESTLQYCGTVDFDYPVVNCHPSGTAAQPRAIIPLGSEGIQGNMELPLAWVTQIQAGAGRAAQACLVQVRMWPVPASHPVWWPSQLLHQHWAPLLKLSTKQIISTSSTTSCPQGPKARDHQAHANSKHGRKPMAIKESPEVQWQRSD